MDEVKGGEEHLLANGNGSIGSTSSDFLGSLPDAQTEANNDDKDDDFSSVKSEIFDEKGNDEVLTKSLSNVRVHSNDDSFVSPEPVSEHKKDENGNHLELSFEVSPNVEKDGKGDPKTHIDTAAPFESVKEAVSKFGGIVDWKAHRVQTRERRQFIEQELEKANDEIPVFKQKSEAAKKAKEQALKDLDSTKRLIEELKLNLERAQTEERQAKQDSELARLRVQEMEQGIADESSVAAKTQLEVAKARTSAAAQELVNVKNELQDLHNDYTVLLSERESALKKAEEAVSEAKQVERAVENLTIELIRTKESIEATHAAHLEAEEHRIGAGMARDQDASSWGMDLKQAEEELDKVHQQIIQAKELKAKLDTASVLLQNLKDELAFYMKEKMGRGAEGENKSTRTDILVGVSEAKKNLEEVNESIENTSEQIKYLKMASAELTAELERERTALKNLRRQDGKAAEAVYAALASEISRARAELDHVRTLEKEARGKLCELPSKLRKASEEADSVKTRAADSRLELKKAKEVAEKAKAGASQMSGRLAAAQREIEAARAAERLALGAISALHDTESARSHQSDDSKGGVTLSLEEYYSLSKKAHDAEEEANERVANATSQIDTAKESEMQSLNKLNQLNSELSARKEALNVALQKAEMAKEGKFNVEQELKRWRAESEERRQVDGHGGNFNGSGGPMSLNHRPGGKGSVPENNSNSPESPPDATGGKKKKRTFMPKFFMFLGKKKPLAPLSHLHSRAHKNA